MLHVLDDTENHTYRTLECRGVPVLLIDDHLPVPLIDIAAVQIIELLIATNRVHVGIETLARLEAVLLQCHSLPLRQRMHDLDRLIRPPWNIEADRTLIAIQIIIETRALRHEKRRRNTAEIHLPTELLLKCISDILDCLLCLTHRKTWIIILWNDQSHTYPLNPCGSFPLAERPYGQCQYQKIYHAEPTHASSFHNNYAAQNFTARGIHRKS